VRSGQNESYVTIASAPDEPSEIAGMIKDIQQRHAQDTSIRTWLSSAVRATRPIRSRRPHKRRFAGYRARSILEKEYMKDVLAILLLITDTSAWPDTCGRQKEHPFSQQDIEALLLAARQPRPMLISY